MSHKQRSAPEIRRLEEAAKEKGWKVTRTKQQHVQFRSPIDGKIVHVPANPGGSRGLANSVAEIKRAMREEENAVDARTRDTLELLGSGPATISELAEALGVARSTARLTLITLENQGKVRKWTTMTDKPGRNPDMYGLVETNGHQKEDDPIDRLLAKSEQPEQQEQPVQEANVVTIPDQVEVSLVQALDEYRRERRVVQQAMQHAADAARIEGGAECRRTLDEIRGITDECLKQGTITLLEAVQRIAALCSEPASV